MTQINKIRQRQQQSAITYEHCINQMEMCMHNETLCVFIYLFIYTFIWGWICIVKCVARMIFFSRFSTNDLPHINHDIEMSISNALSSSNDGNWGLIDFENNPIVFLSLFCLTRIHIIFVFLSCSIIQSSDGKVITSFFAFIWLLVRDELIFCVTYFLAR